MIEQKAVHGAIVVTREVLPETVTVEAARTLLAAKDAAHEAYLGVFGEEVYGFVVQAFVDEVAVRILQAANGMHVLQHADPICELLKLPLQRVDPTVRHLSLQLMMIMGYLAARRAMRLDPDGKPIQCGVQLESGAPVPSFPA
jgi:hypothetical protein